ncbi:glucose-6-phosphate dehydrogenase [Flavihumibacter petaseus]|uniref:Glucose-6-phosphate 1-dehydrogenase n=1 Tax=Flavihumibacter petaseus NBRC 106054 TaxID=1220578 RepID=A0A0E9MZV6_9BACT|nr:glucose-6-phosphate dehydrogenase [Flavihumibacter petaseus]GAO42906.1 glucose-6-phosphate 1-dehydrogenase [Flavihumibacter petaseus NBRC 106054]
MVPNSKVPASIVIFGAGGDLTRRKLIPALFNLYVEGYLPPLFRIFCVDYVQQELNLFRESLRTGITEFSRNGAPSADKWTDFSERIDYISGDFLQRTTFLALKQGISGFEKSVRKRGTRLFYFAISPRFIETVAHGLYTDQLANRDNADRLVIEKPFGTDLASAKTLNKYLLARFTEKQLYRIDHYLGKETVQNIMAFRFANYVFEPLWNKKYIDHIQISVAEKVSVGSRGGYYDGAGALRDMVQNHLLQLLCIVAMECPGAYEAEVIRNAKTKVIRDIRPMKSAQVSRQVVRGQYKGYRQEAHVSSASTTETFIAAKIFIDNARWKGVPFFLRTGKSLEKQSTVIIVQFKDSPHKIFRDDIVPNRLIISIQPELEISLLFESKVPGLQMKLQPVEMDFTYNESYSTRPIPEAYEALLLDVLKGDATLFMRADQVEAAWKAVMPILDSWKKQARNGLHAYVPGSWGPAAAKTLLHPHSSDWILLPETLARAAPAPLK